VSIYNARIERYPDSIEPSTNPVVITMDAATGTQYISYLYDSDAGTLEITGPHEDEPVTSEQDVQEGKYRGVLYAFAVVDDGEVEPGVKSVRMTRDYIHGRFDPQITSA
jgi:hypothetical protein